MGSDVVVFCKFISRVLLLLLLGDFFSNSYPKIFPFTKQKSKSISEVFSIDLAASNKTSPDPFPELAYTDVLLSQYSLLDIWASHSILQFSKLSLGTTLGTTPKIFQIIWCPLLPQFYTLLSHKTFSEKYSISR